MSTQPNRSKASEVISDPGASRYEKNSHDTGAKIPAEVGDHVVAFFGTEDLLKPADVGVVQDRLLGPSM